MKDPSSREIGFYLKATGAVLLVATLVVGYLMFANSPELQRMLRPEAVRGLLDGLGSWGPAVLVGAMAVAIVFSPVPSAPLALAAGAVYGHTWGTVYAVVGAEIGALIAFGLARVLGRPFVSRILPDHLLGEEYGDDRSQWMLAGGVLVARLFPFIYFDAVSYLAGLTRLRLSLFAAATLPGRGDRGRWSPSTNPARSRRRAEERLSATSRRRGVRSVECRRHC